MCCGCRMNWAVASQVALNPQIWPGVKRGKYLRETTGDILCPLAAWLAIRKSEVLHLAPSTSYTEIEYPTKDCFIQKFRPAMTDINLEYRCNHDDCRKGKGLFITVGRWKARLTNLDKNSLRHTRIGNSCWRSWLGCCPNCRTALSGKMIMKALLSIIIASP